MTDTELDQLLNVLEPPAPPPSMRRGLAASLPEPRRRILGIPLRWALAGTAAVLCAVLGAAAFDNPIMGEFYGAVQTERGPIYVVSTRMIDPPVAALKWWFLGSGNSFGGTVASLDGSAYMRNRFANTIYGYQYTLQEQSGGAYQVTFAPFDPATMRPFQPKGQLMAPPPLPAPQTVQLGQPFEVTLYQDSGERIYDRLVVSWTAPQRKTPQMYPGSLSLDHAQLYVDGQLVLTQNGTTAGAVLWVHMPGEGRYIATLNTEYNRRFTQAGHVKGNVMEFASEGRQFRIVSSKPIASGGDQPIFVYHQQSFEAEIDPATPMAGRPFLGSAGPARLHQ